MNLIIPTRWLDLYETKQWQPLLIKAQMGKKKKAVFFPLHNSLQVRILTQYGKMGPVPFTDTLLSSVS